MVKIIGYFYYNNIMNISGLYDLYGVLPDTINGETFSYYLVNIILNMIFCLGVLFASFLVIKTYDKSKISQYFQGKFKYSNIIHWFLYGALISLFSLWYLYVESIHWTYTVFIFAAISFAFFFDFWFYLGFLPLSLASVILTYYSPSHGNEVDQSAIYYLILNVIILVIAGLFFYLTKKLKKKNNTIFLLFDTFLITLSLAVSFPTTFTQSITSLTDYEMLVFGINYIFYFIISFSSFSLFRITMKFIDKTEMLSKKVTFKNDFILQKFANEQIKKYISDNNISCAAVMKLEILGLDLITTEHGSSYANRIKEEAIATIKDNLKELDALFYMQSNDTEYYCMVPLKHAPSSTLQLIQGNLRLFRDPTDSLKFIERKLKEARKIIKQKGFNDVRVATFCSLYGIETNDIDEINAFLSKCQRDNIMALNEIVYVKSDASFNLGKKSKDNILEEFGVFSPTDIVIKLIKESTKNETLYHINAISVKPFLTTKEEIWNVTDNKVIYSALVSHTSAKAIKNYINDGLNVEGNILLIDYPQYALDQKEFNLFELTSRISSYGLKNGEFYLNVIIDSNQIDEILIENLNKIKNAGIDITFDNVPKKFNEQALKKIKSLKPKLINWK